MCLVGTKAVGMKVHWLDIHMQFLKTQCAIDNVGIEGEAVRGFKYESH